MIMLTTKLSTADGELQCCDQLWDHRTDIGPCLQDGDEEANKEEEDEVLRLQSLAAQRLRDEDFEIPELANRDAAADSDGADEVKT